MKKKFLFLLKKLTCITCIGFLALLILNGCVPVSHPPDLQAPGLFLFSDNKAPDNLSAKTVLLNKSFDKIMLSGHIDAQITGGQSHTQLIINNAHPDVMRNFSSHVKNNILYINYGNYPANFGARIPLNLTLVLAKNVNIHQIVVKGQGAQLFAQNISNDSMDVVINGNSQVTLTGNLVLSHIYAHENAILHAYWLNSTHLRITAKDHAKLFLAGIVSQLDLTASNQTVIDAKYLRANKAYARTSEFANAGIFVKQAASIIATGASTVYNYHDSALNTHYLDTSGAMLRMVGITDEYSGH